MLGKLGLLAIQYRIEVVEELLLENGIKPEQLNDPN